MEVFMLLTPPTLRVRAWTPAMHLVISTQVTSLSMNGAARLDKATDIVTGSKKTVGFEI